MDLSRARAIISSLELGYCDLASFIKNKKIDVVVEGLDETQYISMQDLQNAFGISRYHLVKYLKAVGTNPIGERKNYINGKRTRGVGKVVYPKTALGQIREHLLSQADIEVIKQMARTILEN